MGRAEEPPLHELIAVRARRPGAAPAPGSSGPCPDANRLAALVESRLLAEEREVLEAHLAACDDCVSVVSSLAAEIGPPAVAGSSRRLPRALLAAAAVVLAAVALFLVARGVGWPASTAELLARGAADVRAARADLFASFQPLSLEELRRETGVRLRGGMQLHVPVGVLLEPRPTFEWTSSRGGGEAIVQVLGSDGSAVWEATCASPCAYPDDAPALAAGASHVWRVVVPGPFGPEGSSRRFEVAGEDARRAFEAAAAEIERSAPRRVRLLVLAHHALRLRLHVEAERAAARFVEANPDDELGQETLRHVRALMGRSG
jgi:hypothetical protein